MVYKKWPGPEYIIWLSFQTVLLFPKRNNAEKMWFFLNLDNFKGYRDFLRLNACLVRSIIQKECVFQQNVVNILDAKRFDLQVFFTKKICNYMHWLLNCRQRRTKFLLWKVGISQKRLRLRFWNLHQCIPHEKLYRNQLLAKDWSFFSQTPISIRGDTIVYKTQPWAV